jgi:hypothetical protein
MVVQRASAEASPTTFLSVARWWVTPLHAPEVECIGKGKAHRPYEFGVKVSVATTAFVTDDDLMALLSHSFRIGQRRTILFLRHEMLGSSISCRRRQFSKNLLAREGPAAIGADIFPRTGTSENSALFIALADTWIRGHDPLAASQCLAGDYYPGRFGFGPAEPRTRQVTNLPIQTPPFRLHVASCAAQSAKPPALHRAPASAQVTAVLQSTWACDVGAQMQPTMRFNPATRAKRVNVI